MRKWNEQDPWDDLERMDTATTVIAVISIIISVLTIIINVIAYLS